MRSMIIIVLSMLMIIGSTLAKADVFQRAAQPCHPFTQELFAQLGLTPCQQRTARRIVNAVRESLMVRVYPPGELDEITYFRPIIVPIDEIIATDQCSLQHELCRKHPDPILTQSLARRINENESIRNKVISTAYDNFLCILTPAQRQHLNTLIQPSNIQAPWSQTEQSMPAGQWGVPR